MAYYYPILSHTFSEYLLVPGYTSAECVPDRVSLKTPLVKYRKGQEELPHQPEYPDGLGDHAVGVERHASPSRLPRRAGFRSSYGSQSIESEAEMVRRVKS